MINLNVNIDHFATLRNARGENNPDIVFVAQTAEIAGASGIVIHLRKDRRHIKDQDVINIKNNINTHLNLEMSVDKEIVEFACKVKPSVVTIVPEGTNELTTEGGLNVVKNKKIIEQVTKTLQDIGIQVSLFIEPDEKQIELSAKIGANRVEFNTKYFAIACQENNFTQINNEIERVCTACNLAIENNLYIAAGHSLNYYNIKTFAEIVEVQEYNIGHSIVARSTIVGLPNAIKEMIELIYKVKQINICY
jgi:pyridoxine 5-phosphate synthase